MWMCDEKGGSHIARNILDERKFQMEIYYAADGIAKEFSTRGNNTMIMMNQRQNYFENNKLNNAIRHVIFKKKVLIQSTLIINGTEFCIV